MNKAWTRTAVLGAVMLGAALSAGCERTVELEVRTFRLEHLRAHEAGALIDPYVYGDREGAPGSVSATDGAITVRETADNLEQISRVLADFDQARPDTRLHFQLIEADGFTESDASIAAVETELRKILQFRGYRLAAEAFVASSDGSSIQQGLQGPSGSYQITGHVYQFAPGVVRLEGITLWAEGGPALETTVNIRPGQILVLGSAPMAGSTATLLLTVRAQEVEGPA